MKGNKTMTVKMICMDCAKNNGILLFSWSNSWWRCEWCGDSKFTTGVFLSVATHPAPAAEKATSKDEVERMKDEL